MDGWSLPTLVLFPVPSLCVISPCHHSAGLFSQKTRASTSITKNPLITKGLPVVTLSQMYILPNPHHPLCPRGWEYGGLGDVLRLMSFQARYLLPDFLPKYCQLRSGLAPSPTLHTPPQAIFSHINLALLCLMDLLPCAHLCCLPCPSRVFRYIHWPHFRRRRGYLLALTNEYSGAFTIDVV